MKRILLLALLLLAGSVRSQQLITGTVGDMGVRRVYLMSLYGERAPVIDSTVSDSSGRFRFSLSPSRQVGMYRVQWSKEGLIDVIWNRADVVFTTVNLAPEDSLRFIGSEENTINLNYLRLDRTNQSRLELLMPVVDYYPVRDRFHALAVQEMEQIQRSQNELLDSLIRVHPDYYSVRMARVYRTPFLSASLTKEERVNYLKQHYFDKVDFSDTALLRSTVFPNKVISYLALYSNNRLGQKQLQAEFIKAVTVVLSAASVNAEVYKFLLDYLVGGFEKYHFDDVLDYIAANFQDPFACEDQARKSALQKKLENFKRISIGKVAPELDVVDSRGRPFRLSALDAEYTLLVFWSTQCPHCTEMMPKLKTLYEQQRPRRFEVVAFALDTVQSDWSALIKEQKLNWTNISDLKGFAGKPADDYNIYATPTMFLLDREKKILAKPISYRELEQALTDQKLR